MTKEQTMEIKSLEDKLTSLEKEKNVNVFFQGRKEGLGTGGIFSKFESLCSEYNSAINGLI